VFKCLTDTIMLDDFKTELKRLGIKRIQKEEKHRQSIALVLDDKDDDQELEFADALGPRTRLANGNRLSPGGSPNGRLRHDSMTNGSADRRGAAKAQTGRGGRKLAPLPSLQRFSWGKKTTGKGDTDGPDLEKQFSTARKDDEDPSSSNERVNNLRGSLGALDFHTKPAGI
jgi:hypothetical protein